MPAFPGSHLPGPSNFPALNLARPEAWGASRVTRRVQGARAAAGAFRPAGPSCSAPGPDSRAGNVALPRGGRGEAGQAEGRSCLPQLAQSPFSPGHLQRPISQNDSRSGHPKFSGVPNFGRCSGDNCYYWALRCSQSQLHGSIPIKPITLNPLQSRLLEPPCPAPSQSAESRGV